MADNEFIIDTGKTRTEPIDYSWRNQCEHIGWASSNQDKDGFLKVRIKINERY